MDELVRWLTARLDEDERVARAATPGPWAADAKEYPETIHAPGNVDVVAGGRWGGEASVFESTEDALHIAAHDPARVLREIDAKRQVLTTYIKLVEKVTELSAIRDRLSVQGRNTVMTDGELESAIHRRDALLGVLRLLTLSYADRPTYREEWAP